MEQEVIESLYRYFQTSNGISTDTREEVDNCIFFGLRGEHFNGNRFAAKAIEKGARLVIADDSSFCPEHDKCWLVDNSLTVLQKLAAYHRQQFNIPTIAIAGSNGKTTTKELIISVLASEYVVHGTKGNLNNHIGLPLTLLEAKDPHMIEVLILEMGARQEGDIKELCEIGQPTHGLITNAGKDHLETFGSIDNVIKSNAELYRYLAENNGIAFINSDHDYLVTEANEVKNCVYYGSDNKNNHCYGSIINSFPYLTVTYNCPETSGTINTQLTGRYNFENLIAAVCIGHHFNIDQKELEAAIQSYQPSNYRSQIIHKNSNTIILDAYNANPTSMKEAILSFAHNPYEKKVAVLGDMLELGEVSEEEHRRIIQLLAQQNFYEVILVGEEFEKVKDQISCYHFPTRRELQEWLENTPFKNTAFLVKGSRGIALEKAFIDH